MKKSNSNRFEFDKELLIRRTRTAVIIYTPVILLLLNQIEAGEFNINLLYASTISITIDLIRRWIKNYNLDYKSEKNGKII